MPGFVPAPASGSLSSCQPVDIDSRPDQQALFRKRGYLHLQGALHRSAVQPVKAHVQHELKRLAIWSAGRVLSKRLKDVPVFQQVGKLGQLIQYPGLRDRLVTPELSSLISRLAGAPLSSGQEAQLLISLPHALDWTLEGLNWHRDISQSSLSRLPGIQAFVLLDDLSPRGGATLALAGSHRLKRRPQGLPGLARLIGGDDDGFLIDGHELSLLEMSGRAGDVYLMDMRLMHTPSINATRKVRMMATMRYYTASHLDEIA